MKNIIALMGPSGSGKDFILKLLKHSKGRYERLIINKVNFITPATTRPARLNEIHGDNYYFITDERFERGIKEGEFAEFQTFNNWHYGVYKNDIKEECWNIGVFNINAIQLLKINSDYNIYPILCSCSDRARLIRQLQREDNPDIKEILRRYEADKKDFLTIPFNYDIINSENETSIQLLDESYKKAIYDTIVIINSKIAKSWTKPCNESL